MRLLQINSVYNQGSTGKICAQIDTEFRNKSLGESKVIYFWGAKDNNPNAVKCGSFIYAKVIALLSRITGKYGFLSYVSTYKAVKEIKRFNPDIVQLHNIHDHTLNIRLLFNYLLKTNAKIIWTFHDCWGYTGYCGYYSQIECEKWKNNCEECPIRLRYSWFFDKSKYLQDEKKRLYGNTRFEIVTPSHWLKAEVEKSFLKNNKIQVIYNGIDLGVFYPQKSDFRKKYGIEDKYMILGVAYKWDSRKGIDVFLKISALIGEQYRIVLVGDIDLDSFRLPSNIIIIRRTSDQRELAEIYSAADVFANPTREEVFGLVNVEALACGTPVVTFRTGGSPECIDEKCGIVVDKDDVGGMLNSIVSICENRLFSIEMCRTRAEFFDSTKIYRQYIDKYRELISG